jgi:DNA-binding transcriptional MerR regulator
MAEQLAQEVSEQTQLAAPEIPDRLFFRIGDVAELAGVETYVLRFWEGEFPTLAPKKTSNGQRQYRRKDVETVLEIKRLLYAEGYTIAGARKVLQDRVRTKKRHQTQKEQSPLPFVKHSEDVDPPLHSIKRELQEILALLSEH